MEGNNLRQEGPAETNKDDRPEAGKDNHKVNKVSIDPREISKGNRKANTDHRETGKSNRKVNTAPREINNKSINGGNDSGGKKGSEREKESEREKGSERKNDSERENDFESQEDLKEVSQEGTTEEGSKDGIKEELTVVGIKFDPTGKTYDYLQNNVELRCGDYCVVEVDKGEEIARVFRSVSIITKKPGRKPMRRVIRLATPQDLERVKRNDEMGRKAQVACQKKIIERGLPMKLIRVKYSFDGSKAIFYFTAEGRIDFRDLVKDLAARFRTRIEMRQIGVRDEARMISGFGCCGRQLCCSLFLRDFEPVSIRMAKDQCLTLNPGKISGICGRLMCCLVYEAATYEEIRKKLPRLGERVMVKNEEGKVTSFDILKGLVCIEFPDGRVLRIDGSEVQRIKGGKPPSKRPPKPDTGKQGR